MAESDSFRDQVVVAGVSGGDSALNEESFLFFGSILIFL